MSHRILPAVVLLAVTAALTACGGDRDGPPAAASAPPGSASTADPTSTIAPDAGTLPTGPDAPPVGEGSLSAPGAPTPPAGAASPAVPGAPVVPPGAGAPPTDPNADGTTQRRPPSPPPVVLPPRQAGAPTAREVIAAFRAAGLKAANARDRSVECGPDGLGLGCSELVVTDNVAVYVFPDESSADDMADRWSGAAFRSGTVVLNYLEASTPPAHRPRYEKALTTLR
ncbi:hypothetical protein [Micromonospora sp. WMMD1082]|uniref:hypothetical protein n=1 Tax=Micromonospora sp. WMMD1082 TaxID=3016104 RepID=UPI002415D4CB|nr:hypothetical protein [Micromonospora sp. WMMD1082]MDG4792416.1 hypothetical protein [Micromonospora sp. WMMD1082]